MEFATAEGRALGKSQSVRDVGWRSWVDQDASSAESVAGCALRSPEVLCASAEVLLCIPRHSPAVYDSVVEVWDA